MRRNISIAYVTGLLVLLSGCALFKVTPNSSPENDERISRQLERLGRSGTALLLNELEDKQEIAQKLKEALEENALPWLEDDKSQINTQIFEGIIGQFELAGEYKIIAKDAFEELFEYVQVPGAEELLDDRSIKMLKAFITGALDACTIMAEEE